MKTDKAPLTYREIMALSEEERYEYNVYHRWDNAANRRKLGRLYGLVAEKEDADILAAISGRRVLDVGAGYGFFARRLIDHGFEVTAIDPNQELCRLARQWYGVDVLRNDIHEMPFPACSFDTVIFRESVEHLDCAQAFREADRLVTKAILIFQTHLSPAVRLSRLLAGHEELRPEGLEYYQDLLGQLGYTQQQVTFRDIFALPLSGGTLTPQLVPPIPLIENLIVAFDNSVSRLMHLLGMERLFCWRFLLRAQKPSKSLPTSSADRPRGPSSPPAEGSPLSGSPAQTSHPFADAGFVATNGHQRVTEILLQRTAG